MHTQAAYTGMYTRTPPRVPWGLLCKECSGGGTLWSLYLTHLTQQWGNWTAYFCNCNPKILACLVHRGCHIRSLKERQMLRELRNPPRQMQKSIWKYPSVFQQPLMGDWLWKKNCWYDLRTQPTVVRQSAHNDGPSQDNTSSILTDNLDPNTNNIPMPDYDTQVGRWNGNVM